MNNFQSESTDHVMMYVNPGRKLGSVNSDVWSPFLGKDCQPNNVSVPYISDQHQECMPSDHSPVCGHADWFKFTLWNVLSDNCSCSSAIKPEFSATEREFVWKTMAQICSSLYNITLDEMR